jgi:uncharacterized caspase-like protein
LIHGSGLGGEVDISYLRGMKKQLFFLFFLFVSALSLAQKQEPRLVLPVGHLGGITKLDGSPNEKLLLTEDLNSDIVIIDSDKLIELQRHNFEGWKITSSTFLNDSSVISICNDTLVSVWNFYSDKVDLYPISVQLARLYVEKHGLYCIDKKETIYKFQLSPNQIHLDHFISQRAKEIYFKSENEIFLVKGKNLLLLSLAKRKKLKRRFENEITAITCNSKNGNVILGFEDGNLIEINTSFNTLYNLTPASDKISFVEYLSDSSMISGSYNFGVRKESENDSIETMYLDDWVIGGIKSQGFFIACSWNGQLLKFTTEKSLVAYQHFESLLKKSSAFLQKDTNLYISYNDGTVNRFNMNDFNLLTEFKVCIEPLVTFDINSKQNKLIAASKSQLFLYDIDSRNSKSMDNSSNIWTARFFNGYDDYIYSNDILLKKCKDNVQDSIELNAWFTCKLNNEAFFATGENRIVVVDRNTIKSVEFPGLGYIDIGKKLNNQSFLLATMEQRKLYTVDSNYKILNQLNLLKPIIEIEPYGEVSAFLLSEDGSLAVFDSKRKVYKAIKKVQEYGSWDFLLNEKENIIIFPNSDSEDLKMNIDVLRLDGSNIKKLLNVGGEVICISNSYHSIDFNHLDSNQVIFIVSDGSVKLWDINSAGNDPITLLGFDYYNLLKAELGDFNIKGAFLKSGLLKLPIPGIDTLTFMNLKNGNWLVHDSKYRFDGTPGAIEKLYFTCGLEVVELNQVKDSLYVPNLVQRYANGETLKHITQLKDLQICGYTPVIEVIDSLNYLIIPRNGGVGEIAVFINGIQRLTYNSNMLRLDNGIYRLNLSDAEINPFRETGKPMQIKVIAKTADNSVSSRGVIVEIADNQTQTQLKPSIHAIMIGVDDYKDKSLQLKYAAKDANDLQLALQLAAKNYFNIDDTNRVFFYNLTNNTKGETGSKDIRGITPDRGNIIKTLQDIEKTSNPEDIVLLFFAGHGEIVDDEQLLLLTSESTRDNFQGIKMSELLSLMNEIPAGKRVFILDACHSGAAINNLDMAYFSGKRDVKDVERESQRLKELDKLANKSGFAIITASSSDQKALELPQYEHGLLTYSLLSALVRNKSVLTDENQLVLEKWFIAAEEEMQKLNKDQNAEKMVPINFNIGIVDDEVKQSIQISEIPMLEIGEVINESQFINDLFPFDDLGIRGKLYSSFQVLNESKNQKVYLLESAGNAHYKLIIKYLVINNEIKIKCNIIKNGEVIFKAERSEALEKLDSILFALTEEIVKML